MKTPTAHYPPEASDEELVGRCLNGDGRAWKDLIEKYKRLIWSIPTRQGLSEDDAAEVFQTVCVKLFQELERLRSLAALKSWILQVTVHTCYGLHRQRRRWPVDSLENEEGETTDLPSEIDLSEEIEVASRDQLIREALGRQSERCRELLGLLFYEDPPRPYQEVAKRLGLAVGSLGFIRGRCLQSLRKSLQELGWSTGETKSISKS